MLHFSSSVFLYNHHSSLVSPTLSEHGKNLNRNSSNTQNAIINLELTPDKQSMYSIKNQGLAASVEVTALQASTDLHKPGHMEGPCTTHYSNQHGKKVSHKVKGQNCCIIISGKICDI